MDQSCRDEIHNQNDCLDYLASSMKQVEKLVELGQFLVVPQNELYKFSKSNDKLSIYSL